MGCHAERHAIHALDRKTVPDPDRSATLLTTQKNDVFRIITAAGLNPSDFKWVEVQSRVNQKFIVSRLNHRREQYFYFQFDHLDDFYAGVHPVSIYSPGIEKREVTEARMDWGGQLGDIESWIYAVRTEIGAPDLWALHSEASALLQRGAQHQENAPFTADEQKEIDIALRALSREIQALEDVTEEQRQNAEELVEHLRESSKRSGRRDWLLMFTGAVLGWGMNAGLTPGILHQLISAATQQLRRLLG
jgi:hypothetical protein